MKVSVTILKMKWDLKNENNLAQVIPGCEWVILFYKSRVKPFLYK